MDGIPLASRFSLATNRLEFCGPADAEPALYASIVTGTGTPSARQALLKFEALQPYLELIGEKHGLDPLDFSVVEAYWIGNELLEAFERPDFLRLIEKLRRRGLPKSIAGRLAEHLPEDPFPHHAFHVSYVGVGAVTGHVETTIANMDLCRPSWADVGRIEGDSLELRAGTLRWEGGRLALGEPEPRSVHFDDRVLPHVRKGSRLAMHWRWPALELTERQARSLQYYSARAWKAASPSLAVLYPAVGGSAPH